MRSLFLQAPSFDGYDGGAGARYQMKREVKIVLVSDLAGPGRPPWSTGSKLIDAPPHELTFEDIERRCEVARPHRHPHLDAVLQVRLQDRRA